MRHFNNWEKELLRKIASSGASKQVAISKWLEQHYFREADGRALIIQADADFAVFFLESDVYNDRDKKNEEIKQFLELILLLAYLKEKGYISIYRGFDTKHQKMFFMQDRFINPTKKNETIILNAKGEYTKSPDTIHDRDGNIVYRGKYFDLESFEMILNVTTGTMYISGAIEEITGSLNKPVKKETGESIPEQAPKPTAQPAAEAVKPGKSPIENETKNNKSSQHRKIPAHTNRYRPMFYTICIVLMLINNCLVIIQFQKNKHMSRQIVTQLEELKQQFSRIEEVKSKDNRETANQERAQTYYGIDISHRNGDAADEICEADDLTFVICKATEGIHFVDPMFEKNWSTLKSKALIRGAYHFFIVEDDPIEQGDLFIRTVKKIQTTDIAPIIDIEDDSLPLDGTTDKVMLQKNLLKLLKYLESEYKRPPIIYTNLDFGKKYLTRKVFADYPLWIAEYTNRKEPHVPGVWKEKGWKIWQKSASYDLHNGKTDFDIFYGKKEDLYE